MKPRKDDLTSLATSLTELNVTERGLVAGVYNVEPSALVTASRLTLSTNPRERLIGRLNLALIRRRRGPKPTGRHHNVEA